MTREEAITQLELLLEYCESMMTSEYPVWRRDCEALQMLIAALRPVSREQVERIWFREPYTRLETKCGENGDIVYSAVNTCMACGHETPIGNFCHNCGAAQTREAVQMVMERMEALKDGKGI